MQTPSNPRATSRVLAGSGYVAIVASIIALLLGLYMVEAGSDTLESSVDVSAEAVTAVLETIEIIEDATEEVQEGIDAAASGVSGISSTATIGAMNIENVANFLENDLPQDLESIEASMPAAIQAAGAIDGTLRALSFFGVDYNPEIPFDESLQSVQSALQGLPEDLRAQSESMRELVPSAAELSGDAERLSLALMQLNSDLDGISDITTAYGDTLTRAADTLQQTQDAFDANVWLLRILIVVGAVGVGSLGIGLVALSRLMTEALELRSYPVAS